MLGRPAPIELCRAFDLPAKSNFATVIARALLYRAVYKSAVKFLVRLTEGPLPTRKRGLVRPRFHLATKRVAGSPGGALQRLKIADEPHAPRRVTYICLFKSRLCRISSRATFRRAMASAEYRSCFHRERRDRAYPSPVRGPVLAPCILLQFPMLARRRFPVASTSRASALPDVRGHR